MTEQLNILFADLDGTLREPASGDKFINDPTDQQVIEGVREAIAYYHSQKWLIIGVTNQAGVAKGYKSLESALEEQQITLDLISQLQGIYLCPDFEGNSCWLVDRAFQELDISNQYPELKGTYRKPGSGMVRAALSKFKANPADCWMVGDRPEDKLCAEAAGVNFVWADIWRYRFSKDIQGHRFSKIVKPDMSEERISKNMLLKFFET